MSGLSHKVSSAARLNHHPSSRSGCWVSCPFSSFAWNIYSMTHDRYVDVPLYIRNRFLSIHVLSSLDRIWVEESSNQLKPLNYQQFVNIRCVVGSCTTIRCSFWNDGSSVDEKYIDGDAGLHSRGGGFPPRFKRYDFTQSTRFMRRCINII